MFYTVTYRSTNYRVQAVIEATCAYNALIEFCESEGLATDDENIIVARSN